MEVTERNSGTFGQGCVMMVGLAGQNPDDPVAGSGTLTGTHLGRFGPSGGAVKAEAPAHLRVAGARQEGAPAALPALGRDKGRSPAPP